MRSLDLQRSQAHVASIQLEIRKFVCRDLCMLFWGEGIKILKGPVIFIRSLILKELSRTTLVLCDLKLPSESQSSCLFECCLPV